MMNSNLNLSALPECKFAYQMVNSALLIPCIEYQRVLHVEKVAHMPARLKCSALIWLCWSVWP